MQPRLSSGGGGKSNDDIVYELAESILGKIMDKLDIDEANSEMFETDDKGRVNSLTTVLTQETDRYNKLLRVIKVGINGGNIIFNYNVYAYVFTVKIIFYVFRLP